MTETRVSDGGRSETIPASDLAAGPRWIEPEPPLNRADVLVDEFEKLHGFVPPGSEAGDEGQRLHALNAAIHTLPEPRAALCLSGGGIRSATFGLGVLEGLARWPSALGGERSVLERFHYLSTVSGGGYIGSWLSRWVSEEGLDRVSRSLADRSVPSTPTGDPEPQPLRHLRAYSSYLAPRHGLSADLFTLFVTYLRNLSLNWLVLVPLLVAALMIPRVFVALLAVAGHPAWTYALLAVSLILATAAVAFVARNLPSSEPQSPGSPLSRFVLPLTLGALALVLAWPGLSRSPGMTLWSLGFVAACLIAGVVVHLLGVLVGILSGIRAGENGPTLKEVLYDGGAIVVSGAFGGGVLWVGASLLFPDPARNLPLFTIVALPYLLAAYWLGTTAYMALLGRFTDEEDREWWGRAAGLCLAVGALWVGVTVLVFHGPLLLLKGGALASTAIATLGGLAGIGAAVWGYLSKVGVREPSAQPPSWKVKVADAAAPILAGIFILVLAVVISLATSVALDVRYARSKWQDANPIVNEASHHKEHIKKLEAYIDALRDAAPAVTSSEHEVPLQEEKRKVARKVLGKVDDTTFGLGAYFAALREQHKAVTFGLPTLGAAGHVLLWFVGVVVVGLGASCVVGVNRFSLHGMYGNRLVRCYLGASQEDRNPDPFTGFDPNDNVALYQLQVPPDRTWRLFHVLNAALNLSGGGRRLDWQDRQAAPFTMSPLHAGSPVTGYQPSTSYGSEEGLSLGRAMTVSGAAATPAMGYHSSFLVGFAMTFFNARLGWWVPNPGEPGRHVWQRPEPRFALAPVLGELLGRTSEQSPYVYLSDGGHFDNLGLYEMVARRCRRIIVVDASADQNSEYEDLARAIRTIRCDLGIDVEFPDASGLTARSRERRPYAIGRIRYSRVDGDVPDGILIYLKPILTWREPTDVVDYAARSRRAGGYFPHDTTVDQFFDEAQFESYRILGLRSVEALRGDHPAWEDIVTPEGVGEIRQDAFAPSIQPAGVATGNGRRDGNPAVAPIPAGVAPPVAASASPLAWGLGGSMLSAAVVTTGLLTVTGSLTVQPPAEPIPVLMTCETKDDKIVCGTIALKGEVPELKMNRDAKKFLEELKLAVNTEGVKVGVDTEGVKVGVNTEGAKVGVNTDGVKVGVNEEAKVGVNTTGVRVGVNTEGVKVGVNTDGVRVGVNTDGVRVGVNTEGVKVPVDVGKAPIPVTLAELPPNHPALRALRESVDRLESAIRGIGPRRNIRSSGKEE